MKVVILLKKFFNFNFFDKNFLFYNFEIKYLKIMIIYYLILTIICSDFLKSEVIVKGTGNSCFSNTSVNYIKYFPESKKTIVGFGCEGNSPQLDKLIVLNNIRNPYINSLVLDSNFYASDKHLMYECNYTNNGFDFLYYEDNQNLKFFINNYNFENSENYRKIIPINFFSFIKEYQLVLRSSQSNEKFIVIREGHELKIYRKNDLSFVKTVYTYTKNFSIDGDNLYYMNNKILKELNMVSLIEKDIDQFKEYNHNYNLISKKNDNFLYFSNSEANFYNTDLITKTKDTINLGIKTNNFIFRQFLHLNDTVVYSFNGINSSVIDLKTKNFKELDFLVSDATEHEFIMIEKDGYSLINKQNLNKETFIFNHNRIEDIYVNEENIIYTSNNANIDRENKSEYNVLLNYDLIKNNLNIIDYSVSNPKFYNDSVIYCSDGVLKSYSIKSKNNETILNLIEDNGKNIKYFDKYNNKYYLADGKQNIWIYDVDEKKMVDSLKTYNNFINKIHIVNNDLLLLGVSTRFDEYNFIIYDLKDKYIVKSSDKNFVYNDEFPRYSIDGDKLIYTLNNNTIYVYDLLNLEGSEFETEIKFELENPIMNTYQGNIYLPLTNEEGVNKVLVYNIASGNFIKEFEIKIDKELFLFNTDEYSNNLKFVFNNEKYLFYFDSNKNLHKVENTYTNVEYFDKVECKNLKEIEYYDMNGKRLKPNELLNRRIIVKYQCLESNKYTYKLEFRE